MAKKEQKKPEFRFNSLDELKKQFPYFCTATVFKMAPIPRGEASLRHRAQRKQMGGIGATAPMTGVVNGQIISWLPPTEPSTIDIIELRGSIFMKNGAMVPLGSNEDTGPLYINHYYIPDREILEDFGDGDVITVLHKMPSFGYYKGKNHPEFIFNHETRTVVSCRADLTAPSFETVQKEGIPHLYHSSQDTRFAVAAFHFLEDNKIIPPPVNSEKFRPNKPGEITFYNTPEWSCRSCIQGCGVGLLKCLLYIVIFIAMFFVVGWIYSLFGRTY